MVDDFWKWFRNGLYRNFFRYIGKPTAAILGPGTAESLAIFLFVGGIFFFSFLISHGWVTRAVVEAGFPIWLWAPLVAISMVSWMMFWMGASFWREDRD